MLRALAEDPKSDIATTISQVGATKNVVRMVAQDSTLGGLLGDKKPARAKKTVILLNIRSAAQATNDLAYSFSGGPGERRCAAEHLIVGFLQEVSEKLIEAYASPNREDD